MVAQMLFICVALGGNTGHGYQHRHQLQLDHRRQNGPYRHPGPECHHPTGWQAVTHIRMDPAAVWSSITNMV